MLATVRCGAGENRQRRVGERAYMGALRFGQRLFAILFRECERMADFRRFPASNCWINVSAGMGFSTLQRSTADSSGQ